MFLQLRKWCNLSNGLDGFKAALIPVQVIQTMACTPIIDFQHLCWNYLVIPSKDLFQINFQPSPKVYSLSVAFVIS